MGRDQWNAVAECPGMSRLSSLYGHNSRNEETKREAEHCQYYVNALMARLENPWLIYQILIVSLLSLELSWSCRPLGHVGTNRKMFMCYLHNTGSGS